MALPPIYWRVRENASGYPSRMNAGGGYYPQRYPMKLGLSSPALGESDHLEGPFKER